jgi:hypothetical protein
MRRRLSLRLLASFALVALAAPSCLSPTLPLPPPEVPDAIRIGSATGTWEVFGHCTRGAIVTVFNENAGVGVVFEDRDATGSYHVIVEGAECDVARVWEDVGGERSASKTFVLAPHEPGDPTDNPACH